MLNIAQLEEMIWRPLGMDSNNDPDMPRTLIHTYLNRAFWEIQDRFPFREKEKTIYFDTVAGLNRYEIPEPVEAIKNISILNPTSSKYNTLDRITDFVYFNQLSTLEENQTIPQEYVIENCFVRLWPVPDDEYTIALKKLITLDDLSDDETTPDVPRVWHEIIGYGGLWRAYFDLGDHARAFNIKGLAEDAVSKLESREFKEESANVQNAGLEVLGREY